MADYLYDIFVSYERDWLLSNWMKDHFLPFLQTWLRNAVPVACGRPAKPIFFDRSRVDKDFPQELKQELAGIEPGDDWTEGLKKGLRYSRCLIAVWNPPYFYSDWCNIEWQSFEKRSRQTGKRLVIPVLFYDGKSFPEAAQKAQSIDLKPYALDGQALRNRKDYGDFQELMRLLAERAAAAICDAPQFAEWELEENRQPSAPPAVDLPRFGNAR